jgi:hypothetical protein
MRLAAAIVLLAAATFADEPTREELARENERLRQELAGLRAGAPDAVLRNAVEEYLATHAPDHMPRAPADVAYQSGFVLATGDGMHLLRINVGSQIGWHRYRDLSEEHSQARAQHKVTHLRLRLSGHAFTERLTYFVDLEFGPNAERFATDTDALSEGWMRYRRPSWDHVRLQGGRFRPRFCVSENVDDFALALVARGLVNEFFTVGRTDGLAIQLENLREGRSSLELALTNGSEIFDPDSIALGDDKRYAYTFRWSRTLIGEGNPWAHTAYEGDPYESPEGTLVLGIGVHHEVFDSLGASRVAKFFQATVDVMWRRAGSYASVQFFWRRNRTVADEPAIDEPNDFGVQATVSRFVIPRRMEIAFRAGWIG